MNQLIRIRNATIHMLMHMMIINNLAIFKALDLIKLYHSSHNMTFQQSFYRESSIL